MNSTLLLSVLFYEIFLILGVGLFLRQRHRHSASQREGEFALAAKSLPLATVGITLALTVLGAPHIMGMFEMTWHMGAVTLWFTLAHVALLVFVCLTTGRWVRRMGVTTVSEVLEGFFGKGLRLTISCVMVGLMFGFMTLEAQGSGIILAAMTGWNIASGVAVGVCCGVLLVIFAGMRELGLVNLINAGVMYLAVILATIFLALRLPGGNYDSVARFYTDQHLGWMLSVWGKPELLIGFALSTTLAVVCCVGFSQVLLQPAMAADSEATVRRAMWIAAPLNGLWGAFMVMIGLTARSLPEFQALGPKLAAPAMLVAYLPSWLSALLLAAFLSAIVANFSAIALGCATMLSFDIYKPLYNPNASEADMTKMSRLMMLVMSGLTLAVAAYLPPILPAISWLFSWGIPIFWITMFGFFWKRSPLAAGLTLGVTWIVNAFWTFTPMPQLLNLPPQLHIFVTLSVTLLIGVLANLLCQGRPGYFKDPASRLQVRNPEIIPEPGV